MEIKKELAFFLSILIIASSFSVLDVSGYVHIPPTPAFSKVIGSNGTVYAKNYTDHITFKGLRGIKVFVSNSSKTVYINDTSVNATSPNAATGINIGRGGKGLYSGGVNNQLQFRNVTSLRTDLITVSQNGTDVNLNSNFKINNSTCPNGQFVNQIGNHSSITCSAITQSFVASSNQTNGGNRTGITSQAQLMHGLGLIITTGSQGWINVQLGSGWVSPTTTSSGCRLTIQYGLVSSIAVPTAGQALVGTQAFNNQQLDSAVAGDKLAINLGGWIKSLNPNVKYWVDLSEANIGSVGSCDVDNPSLSLTGY